MSTNDFKERQTDTKGAETRLWKAGRERPFHVGQLSVIYQEAVDFRWPLRGGDRVSVSRTCLIMRMSWGAY